MSWLDKLAASTLPLVPRPLVRRLSRRYIAGEERADALRHGEELARAGYRLTYDLLGEAVTERAEVEDAAEEYAGLLAELGERGLERNVSLKPTAMGLDVDEDLCFATTERLVAQAARDGGFVRFEMEDSPTIPGTLRVFERLRAQHGEAVGCVLQSMVRRAEDDARRLLEVDAPLNVRLVKGIYVEPEDVAYQGDDAVCAAYRRILALLLDGGAFVAVATHDEKLLAALEEELARRPAARERVEVQMLLGVREELRSRVHASGMPVRVYVPYGRSWHPYVLRRLRGNPKLARYALLGLFGKRESLD